MIFRILIGFIVRWRRPWLWLVEILISCSSGDCPLTSHPVICTIYDSFLSVLVATSFY